MVQEIPSDIPEELYNLTQLAYVSYAAPKLNTETSGRTAHEKDYLRDPPEPKAYSGVKQYTVPYYDASAGMINLSPADYYTPPSYRTSLSHADSGRVLILEDRGGVGGGCGQAPVAAPNAPLEEGMPSLGSPVHTASMAEATKKKWTKKWEIIQGPEGFGEAPQMSPIPAHVSLSPNVDGSRDNERSSLILYAPTIRRTDSGDQPDGYTDRCPTSNDKDVQQYTIIGSSGQQDAVSCFGDGPQGTSFSEDQASGRFGGVSASEESQDSAVVECYYSHKVFDRKKARKIRTASCTSTTSAGGGSATPSGGDGASQDRIESDGCVGEMDATNDSGHVEADPAVIGTGCNSSGEDVANPGFDVHVCPECNKRYSTSSNLARHRQTHRSLEDKKARKCPFCSKVYVSMPAYSMHVRTHNQGCECPTCGKCFSRPWLLQGHIRTHTGEKPFQCNVCHKAFADKSNLRAHVQTHSNTKPHACSRCGKSFALKSYLYKHEDSSCLKNERPAKAPKPPVGGRTRRKVPKERPAAAVTVSASTTEPPRSSPPVLLASMANKSDNPSIHQELLDSRHRFPPNVPFKDVVRAKIREVVEDNCKKTARLLAAASTAGQQQAPFVPDNRISVIRIAGSSSSGVAPALFAPDNGQCSGQPVEHAPRGAHPPRGAHTAEYPGNYAVIA